MLGRIKYLIKNGRPPALEKSPGLEDGKLHDNISKLRAIQAQQEALRAAGIEAAQ